MAGLPCLGAVTVSPSQATFAGPPFDIAYTISFLSSDGLMVRGRQDSFKSSQTGQARHASIFTQREPSFQVACAIKNCYQFLTRAMNR
jgi:hypothetical protein